MAKFIDLTPLGMASENRKATEFTTGYQGKPFSEIAEYYAKGKRAA